MMTRDRQITLLYEMKALKHLIEKYPKESKQILDSFERTKIKKSAGFYCVMTNLEEKVGA